MQLRVHHVAPLSAQRGTHRSLPRGFLRYGYNTPLCQYTPRVPLFAQSAPSRCLLAPTIRSSTIGVDVTLVRIICCQG